MVVPKECSVPLFSSVECVLHQVGRCRCGPLDVADSCVLLPQILRCRGPVSVVDVRLYTRVLTVHHVPGRLPVYRQYPVLLVLLREPPRVVVHLHLNPVCRHHPLPEETWGVQGVVDSPLRTTFRL